MYNAITLENVVNSVYDSVNLDFNALVSESETTRRLREKDIPYENIWMSLGIFGICLAALLLLLLVYALINLLALRFSCCVRVRGKLRAKLFYSVWIRYMTESYLKMSHSCIFYLAISASWAGLSEQASTGIRIALLALIVIWPFFLCVFLCVKRNQLDQAEFKRKFISMYSGLKLKKLASLMYTPVFCVRRLLLVCTLLALQQNAVWLVLAFNAIQSLYFWYITHAKPHADNIHNWLEYFNELCLIVMQYLMFVFLPGGVIEPEAQWQMGYFSMGLLAFLFLVNIVCLVGMTVAKVKFWVKVRRAKKLRAQALL